MITATSARIAVRLGQKRSSPQPPTAHASTKAAMEPAPVLPMGTSSKIWGVGEGAVSPIARAAKMATTALDAGSSGQNLPPPQPDVTPSRAAASISANKGCEVGTSENVALEGGLRSCPDARINNAIVEARELRQAGQKYGGLEEHPFVMPSS